MSRLRQCFHIGLAMERPMALSGLERKRNGIIHQKSLSQRPRCLHRQLAAPWHLLRRFDIAGFSGPAFRYLFGGAETYPGSFHASFRSPDDGNWAAGNQCLAVRLRWLSG